MSHCIDFLGSFYHTRLGCGSNNEIMAIIIRNTLTMKGRSSKIEELPKKNSLSLPWHTPKCHFIERKNDKISVHILSCVSISLLLQDPFPISQLETQNNITKNHHNKKILENIQTQKMVATKHSQVSSQPPSQLSLYIRSLTFLVGLPQKQQARKKTKILHLEGLPHVPNIHQRGGYKPDIRQVFPQPGKLRPLPQAGHVLELYEPASSTCREFYGNINFATI